MAGWGVAGFYRDKGDAYSEKRVKQLMGSPTGCSGVGPHQPPLCPDCGSSLVWRDGFREDGITQRWLCRECDRRFSDSTLKNKKTKRHTSKHQVCVSEKKMINLVAVEAREKQAAGATVATKADLKGKIVEYLWFMKKQGYAEDTIRLYVELMDVLIKRGAHIYDPESIKEVIAAQETWGNARKSNAVKAYSVFLTMVGLTWKKPKYKISQKLPFIPMESEIDDLIARCSKQMATYLQVLKETAARRGEAFFMKWTDVDLVTRTIRITPEKGSNPRIFRMSDKLAGMLGSLNRTAENQKIWIYKNRHYLDKQFRRQRKRVAHKLGNPRILKIHFHTFRHWKATMLYHQTKDVLYVMQFLGHRSIENTLKYIQLAQALFGHLAEEYICKVAKSLKEATELVEAGFEYVTEMNDCKIFRKPKTSFLGSPSTKKGSSASLV